MYTCSNDGGVFDGEPRRFPVSYENNKFVLSPLVFCSYECVKCYLVTDISTHANILELFHLYCLRNGIECVRAAPHVSLLASRNIHKKGLSLEEYRAKNKQEQVTVTCVPGVYTQEVITGVDVLGVDVASDTKGLSDNIYQTFENERADDFDDVDVESVLK